MKTRGVLRPKALGRPRYYLSESTRHITLRKLSDRPVKLGEFYSVGNQPGGGWARFIPPKESIEVRLKIPQGGKPYEAMREWFIRRGARRSRRQREFNLASLAPLWNLGGFPQLEEEACGSLHLSGSYITQWPTDAIAVWADSGCQGIHPAHIWAILEPEHRFPFFHSPGKSPVPPKNRWLYLPVDLARPLEKQFDEGRRTVEQIRDYAFLLSRMPIPRPGRRDSLRKVLIFTLHYSAGRSIPEIAKELFSEESKDSRFSKVKGILREVRSAIINAGFSPPTLPTHRRT
jgi:hypothetical protein